jgi:hypothetical protein
VFCRAANDVAPACTKQNFHAMAGVTEAVADGARWAAFELNRGFSAKHVVVAGLDGSARRVKIDEDTIRVRTAYEVPEPR